MSWLCWVWCLGCVAFLSNRGFYFGILRENSWFRLSDWDTVALANQRTRVPVPVGFRGLTPRLLCKRCVIGVIWTPLGRDNREMSDDSRNGWWFWCRVGMLIWGLVGCLVGCRVGMLIWCQDLCRISCRVLMSGIMSGTPASGIMPRLDAEIGCRVWRKIVARVYGVILRFYGNREMSDDSRNEWWKKRGFHAWNTGLG
jgi:hypothetical protein